MTGAEYNTIMRQPIPVEGEATELELATERGYEQEFRNSAVAREAPPTKPTSTASAGDRLHPLMGRGAVLKARLEKMDMGEGWTRLSPKDRGPDVGRPYKPCRHR